MVLPSQLSLSQFKRGILWICKNVKRKKSPKIQLSASPLAPGTCERRQKPKWTCVWAFTRAPCWEECSDRRGGSLMFGPQMLLWPIRWSLEGFLGRRTIFYFHGEKSKSFMHFIFKRFVCDTGGCIFPRPLRTVCTESLNWSRGMVERGASTCWRKASTLTWFLCLVNRWQMGSAEMWVPQPSSYLHEIKSTCCCCLHFYSNHINRCFFMLFLHQKPGTLSNRNSNQLINTTTTNGNAASPQSTPTESKQEVNYDECLYLLSTINLDLK